MSELVSHRHGSFGIPVSGLLNSVSSRAAQGQDVGSPPRLEQGTGKRMDACSPPSHSPAPASQGQTSPSEPWHWDALQEEVAYGCMELAAARRLPGLRFARFTIEGDRRQMSLIQGEGQWWRKGKAACALCRSLETFLKIHRCSVFMVS